MPLPEAAQVDRLRSRATPQRTVVGVVGSTGAGKSSTINAVLDEEGLVPTNPMRACTASVTEIAYNPSDNKDEKYRAEIHFQSRDEWMTELRAGLDDMQTAQVDSDTGGSTGNGGDASVPLQKLRLVYPTLKSDDLRDGSVTIETLADEASVKDLLVAVKQIASSNSKDFLELLKPFIDSKEKTGDKTEEPGTIEYWPLINAVKIFVRSPILKTGLILVDLPGIHDSNAARAAIANGYIKQCSRLWIVTPITRTVDDKTTQTLLGDSFKRQLQFDGTYSKVTMICSKTDEFSVTDFLERILPPGHPVHQLNTQYQLLETERNKHREAIVTSKSGRAEINRARKRGHRATTSAARKRIKLQPTSETKDGDNSELEDKSVASEAEVENEQVSRETVQQRLEQALSRRNAPSR
ncbi:hypothetical protein C8A01DRAFT_43650 [Parachaetomium inaequale]|uniref:Dynamin N-terminal domain-containing protein n=1 Tax=Parachaetomium inaequale TaxID=2588326 RepID=A0AAN6PM78_9PEZI|nr:hypothetical protein C8A01DRAFT_43650 [Parachaetomium inaequale]